MRVANESYPADLAITAPDTPRLNVMFSRFEFKQWIRDRGIAVSDDAAFVTGAVLSVDGGFST